ncbi:release factor glutamine methyltransferase [Leucobacter exalbidus]|uniref:Release factor glutamine methyltransferase n=1 Tax=Leucobacter exalbidus TaxID=662960 RepID=A0A940PM56_9MICO|nr:peptide chain release factor N(5)-glutamine methyltransferase [Leucobacter exalbidus]MBP1325658.1 release factor glutamine methyltransferase [Leucobacter exalbidus]
MASHSRALQQQLRQLADTLAAAGIDTPMVDAELLAGHVLGESRGRVQALAIMGRTFTEAQHAQFEALGQRRAERVPLQHLTGLAPFRTLELKVGPGVFVPRPETELIAQIAIDELALKPDPLALDLCTGSGALALAMAHEVPTARIWAVEKDETAYSWAAQNVADWGDHRVTLLLGDIAELDDPDQGTQQPAGEIDRAITPLLERFAVLASNPPYVPASEIPVDPEVREHDPDLALYSGSDGLDAIRILSRAGRRLLAPGGLIVLEHTEEQGAAIRGLLARDGWQQTHTHVDLTGRDRATSARLPGQAE